MTDLISRQAALNTVIKMRHVCDTNDIDDYAKMLFAALGMLPNIDAVPVVRCKDCKHRPIDTGGHNYGQDLFFPDEDNVCPCQCGDPWYSWMPGDDWFCANGERREDD